MAKKDKRGYLFDKKLLKILYFYIYVYIKHSQFITYYTFFKWHKTWLIKKSLKVFFSCLIKY